MLEPEEVPEHECVVNHQGSAGSMEAAALIDMVEFLFHKFQVSVASVITEDDSKMKAQCKWSNADFLHHHGYEPEEKRGLIVASSNDKKFPYHQLPIYRKDGLLKYPVPEPTFLADPAHRKKTFRNKLYIIKAKSVKANHGIKDGDIMRLTMYYAYFIRQLKYHPEHEWVIRGRAIVDHHFDKHAFCGEWCARKLESDEEKKHSTKQYRDINASSNLYGLLCEAIAPFISFACLRELAHGANTNVNESLNQTISWFAPKNRTYCGSTSLRNRVGMAVSIHLVGYNVFYKELFETLGLTVDERMSYCLDQAQRERLQHMENHQSPAFKEKRRASYFAKMKVYFSKLEEDKRKGQEYSPGVAFPETCNNKETTGSSGTMAQTTIVRCKRCGGIGHKTANSKMCKFHRSRLIQNSRTRIMTTSPVKGVTQSTNILNKTSNVSRHDPTHDSPNGGTTLHGNTIGLAIQELSVVDMMNYTTDLELANPEDRILIEELVDEF